MRRFPVRVEMEVCGAPGWVSGDVFAPDEGAEVRNTVLFCLPGGGVTRRYFDIPGDEAFSFVRAMTQRGYVCATFDHPGTGESVVPADAYALDGAEVARVDTLAVSQVAADLRYGRVSPELAPLNVFRSVGVGHSMGAMIVTLQQAGPELYDAVALLCFTTRGLPEVLSAEEQAVAARAVRSSEDYARLALTRFGEPLPIVAQAWRGESVVAAALGQVQGRMPAASALQSMLPGNVAAEAAEVAVPIFLAAGDRDLTGPPQDIPAAFSACHDLRLVVVPRCGHHPFVTAGAARLYACFADWVEGAASA